MSVLKPYQTLLFNPFILIYFTLSLSTVILTRIFILTRSTATTNCQELTKTSSSLRSKVFEVVNVDKGLIFS